MNTFNINFGGYLTVHVAFESEIEVGYTQAFVLCDVFTVESTRLLQDDDER